MLHILTVLLAAFKLSFFSSSFPSSTSSHSCHIVSPFKPFSSQSDSPILSSSLCLLTRSPPPPPPPTFSSPPLSSYPPAISYLPQGEAGDDTAALGSQEHCQHLRLDFYFPTEKVTHTAKSQHGSPKVAVEFSF